MSANSPSRTVVILPFFRILLSKRTTGLMPIQLLVRKISSAAWRVSGPKCASATSICDITHCLITPLRHPVCKEGVKTLLFFTKKMLLIAPETTCPCSFNRIASSALTESLA
ncbi:hypothetical protein A7D33_10100 [Candidatus Methylacidiphilum fumarolicum]|nr:hypothetical protein A7D33_10100 [Candidatus Methylacidiphilum fumarolicum]